ncbi:MAG: WxL protein peptidoglycan domain-containing protein [Candidatus Dormibacteria bacterium]
MRPWLAALIAIAAAATLSTSSARAGAQSAPGLRPAHPGPFGQATSGYFDYTLNPGETRSDDVIASNGNDTGSDFPMFAVDGETSDLSGVVYTDQGAPLTHLGTWIHLPLTTLHLDPGATTDVTFTVTVPAGTPSGDYVGGVAAASPDSTTTSGGPLALKVVQRTILAVVVHVPGASNPGLQVGSSSITLENNRRQVLGVTMANTGNVFIKPVITGDLETMDGKPVVTLDRQLDTFVPFTTITYPFYLDGIVLGPAQYRLRMTASLGPSSSAPPAQVNDILEVTPAVAHVTLPAANGAPPVRFINPPPSSPVGQTNWPALAVAGVVALLALNGLGISAFLRRNRRAAAGPPAG